MPNNYVFKIKKGKIELEVSSDNKYFVITQYDKIFKDFTGSAQKPVKAEKPQEKQVEPIKQAEPAKQPEIKPEQAEPELKTEEPEPVAGEKFKPDKELDEFLYKRNFERDATPQVQTAEQEEEEEQVEGDLLAEEEESVVEKVPANKGFEDIMQQKIQEQEEVEETEEEEPQEELEPELDEEEQEVAEELRKSFEEEEETPKKSKVYDILEEKLSVLPEEERNKLNLNRKEDKAVMQEEKTSIPPNFKNLADLISIKKPQTKLDYLLITAYCLQEKEGAEKYSLKQINSVVVPHLKEPIDHSIIHEAVGHEYLEVVPDYPGSDGITQYTISKHGEDYILNEL